MPISVLCPSCKARFSVSEKFAGKKGPCPKCKATITVPEAPTEEIKIHAPEAFASGGKDAKGRPLTKPIARKDAKFKPVQFAAIAAIAIVVLGIALVARKMQDVQVPIIVVGLAILSPVLAAAGYTFLRNDELEPYRGRSLWIRSAICAVVYAALWGGYALLAKYEVLSGEPYLWIFAGPAFIGIGGTAALAALDLDFASGAFHYCFYLLVTLLLRAAIGLPAVWEVAKS